MRNNNFVRPNRQTGQSYSQGKSKHYVEYNIKQHSKEVMKSDIRSNVINSTIIQGKDQAYANKAPLIPTINSAALMSRKEISNMTEDGFVRVVHNKKKDETNKRNDKQKRDEDKRQGLITPILNNNMNNQQIQQRNSNGYFHRSQNKQVMQPVLGSVPMKPEVWLRPTNKNENYGQQRDVKFKNNNGYKKTENQTNRKPNSRPNVNKRDKLSVPNNTSNSKQNKQIGWDNGKKTWDSRPKKGSDSEKSSISTYPSSEDKNNVKMVVKAEIVPEIEQKINIVTPKLSFKDVVIRGLKSQAKGPKEPKKPKSRMGTGDKSSLDVYKKEENMNTVNDSAKIVENKMIVNEKTEEIGNAMKPADQNGEGMKNENVMTEISKENEKVTVERHIVLNEVVVDVIHGDHVTEKLERPATIEQDKAVVPESPPTELVQECIENLQGDKSPENITSATQDNNHNDSVNQVVETPQASPTPSNGSYKNNSNELEVKSVPPAAELNKTIVLSNTMQASHPANVSHNGQYVHNQQMQMVQQYNPNNYYNGQYNHYQQNNCPNNYYNGQDIHNQQLSRIQTPNIHHNGEHAMHLPNNHHNGQYRMQPQNNNHNGQFGYNHQNMMPHQYYNGAGGHIHYLVPMQPYNPNYANNGQYGSNQQIVQPYHTVNSHNGQFKQNHQPNNVQFFRQAGNHNGHQYGQNQHQNIVPHYQSVNNVTQQQFCNQQPNMRQPYIPSNSYYAHNQHQNVAQMQPYYPYACYGQYEPLMHPYPVPGNYNGHGNNYQQNMMITTNQSCNYNRSFGNNQQPNVIVSAPPATIQSKPANNYNQQKNIIMHGPSVGNYSRPNDYACQAEVKHPKTPTSVEAPSVNAGLVLSNNQNSQNITVNVPVNPSNPPNMLVEIQIEADTASNEGIEELDGTLKKEKVDGEVESKPNVDIEVPAEQKCENIEGGATNSAALSELDDNSKKVCLDPLNNSEKLESLKLENNVKCSVAVKLDVEASKGDKVSNFEHSKAHHNADKDWLMQNDGNSSKDSLSALGKLFKDFSKSSGSSHSTDSRRQRPRSKTEMLVMKKKPSDFKGEMGSNCDSFADLETKSVDHKDINSQKVESIGSLKNSFKNSTVGILLGREDRKKKNKKASPLASVDIKMKESFPQVARDISVETLHVSLEFSHQEIPQQEFSEQVPVAPEVEKQGIDVSKMESKFTDVCGPKKSCQIEIKEELNFDKVKNKNILNEIQKDCNDPWIEEINEMAKGNEDFPSTSVMIESKTLEICSNASDECTVTQNLDLEEVLTDESNKAECLVQNQNVQVENNCFKDSQVGNVKENLRNKIEIGLLDGEGLLKSSKKEVIIEKDNANDIDAKRKTSPCSEIAEKVVTCLIDAVKEDKASRSSKDHKKGLVSPQSSYEMVKSRQSGNSLATDKISYSSDKELESVASECSDNLYIGSDAMQSSRLLMDYFEENKNTCPKNKNGFKNSRDSTNNRTRVTGKEELEKETIERNRFSRFNSDSSNFKSNSSIDTNISLLHSQSDHMKQSHVSGNIQILADSENISRSNFKKSDTEEDTDTKKNKKSMPYVTCVSKPMKEFKPKKQPKTYKDYLECKTEFNLRKVSPKKVEAGAFRKTIPSNNSASETDVSTEKGKLIFKDCLPPLGVALQKSKDLQHYFPYSLDPESYYT